MVTVNISTEVSLTNGTTGKVMDIVLDPHENSVAEGGVRQLSFPPAYIVFKPVGRVVQNSRELQLGASLSFPANKISICFQCQVNSRQ
jgi:hypothetical protein